jgi:hypothetical protein
MLNERLFSDPIQQEQLAPAPTEPLPAQSPQKYKPTHTRSASTASASSQNLAPPDITTKLARQVSPALLARMKFLNQTEQNANKSNTDVGRIDEDELRRLDALHKRRGFNIQRRGTAWSGIGPPPGTELLEEAPLASESVPPPAVEELVTPEVNMEPDTESDHSSTVSTSDRVLPSESEAEVDDVDVQKYRLPDISNTKTLSQTVTATPPSQTLTPTPPRQTNTTTPPEPPVVEPSSPPSSPPTSMDAPKAAPEAAADTPPDTPPPPPPPKDTPPAEEASVLTDDNGIDVEAYFQKRHLRSTNSVYTLSKASFTNQIQGLTSMKLPPTTIASEIISLPSSTLAGRALYKAANDIRLWMTKATEVLSGLDAEDDVEWAAAAGREGLAEVDAAIGKFEGLVTVYISAIEDLQARSDISLLPAKDQTTLVGQMEDVVSNWANIKTTLKGIKSQVEIAMEWEELWNNVLGEIGAEVENLSRLVFEMEERRHRVISDSVAESAEKFDIAELATIVKETPRQPLQTQSKRFSMPPTLAVMSPISPIPQIEQENSRLLALFAKLQPLRASLDFLPMRLATFQGRARTMFPSACDELMRRKEQLEDQEKKLEAEADALREELGEDKWVHSFRQAGSKAVAMYDSCMKSIQRLTQAIDEHDEEKMSARIATYKDKRDHYPPSMRRVLELIDIEMTHRSTVNGEILRIQQDVRQKVTDLESVIKDMDAILDDFTASRKLRDSVSTVLSARTEASLSSSALDTPNSSPASSVVMGRKSSDFGTQPAAMKKTRQFSSSSAKAPSHPSRRYSSLPPGAQPGFYISNLPLGRLDMTPNRSTSSTPTRRSITPVSEKPAVKPRWNSSTNMNDTIVGHNYRPLTLTLPSPYARSPDSARSASRQSSIPVRSPLGRSSTLSPQPPTRPMSTTPARQAPKRTLASPMQSPATPAQGRAASRQATPRSSTPRHASIAEEDDTTTGGEESPIARRTSRHASVANSRRSSALPTPKQAAPSSNLTPTTTPVRTRSRLGSIDEGRNSRTGAGWASRVGGRQSSAGDRSAWK